jgi:ligand-binding sensor domain-containing protein/putative methionine-R-sulfoxide reductase with GAF domain
MLCRIFRFIFLFSLLSQHAAVSQPVQYRFQHLSNEDGLPHNTVYDICQDKYGFMWFSTRNGVSRYDGYSFRNYKPSEIFTGEVTDLTQCIRTAHNGNIVFGTGTGMYIIDIEKDSIIRAINFSVVDSNDVYINNVSSLAPDGDIIWVGTGNGLFKYDMQSNTFKHYSGATLIPGFKEPRFWIKSVVTGPDGMVWLTSQGGLVKLDPKTGKTTVFNRFQEGGRYVDNEYFSSLTFDKKGRLWAGTLRQGLFRFDFRDSSIARINITGLSDSSQAFNEIKRLITARDGNIWAATQYTGVAKIDPDQLTYYKIRSGLQSVWSIRSDLVSALYEDKSGILWAGTYNSGISRTGIQGSQFVNIPYSGIDSSCFAISSVECFAEQDQENIWVGTIRGLYLFNRKSQSCRSFEEVTGGQISLPHQSINGLVISGNKLWIGTRSKIILRVDLSNNTFETFRPDSSLMNSAPLSNFTSMTQTADGELFFSFLNSLQRYDSASNSLKAVIDRGALLSTVKRIGMLWPGKKGQLFITSDQSGAFIYNTKNNVMQPIVPTDSSYEKLFFNARIIPRENGAYYLSSYRGLYELESDFRMNAFYNEKNGLSDNKITSIQTDNKNKLWLATFNGLSMFDPETKSFRNYYVQDGLMDQEFREARSFKTADGQLLFPTSKGFTMFSPEGIRSAEEKPFLFFTSVSISGAELKLESNINSLAEIHIPAGNNNFSISFGSSAYNTLAPDAFAYKLDGVDDNWVYSGRHNTANYTNMQGGKYLFRVKLFPDSEEKTILICIGTVFYKTWWFRSILLLSLAFLIYALLRFRDSQNRKKESLKIIDYFATSFYGKNTVEEILWDVCRNCISRLGFEDAVAYLVEEDRGVLVQKAAYGPKNPKDFEIADPIEIPIGSGIVGTVALTGIPEIVNDTTRDPRYIADDDTRYSELAVPIIHMNKVLGVIDSEHSKKTFFTKSQLQIVSTIASICATKIAKAQSDLAAQDRERRLLEIGKKVAETRLMALRAQMNPHFIFNSLNSIQECIVNHKIEDAHTYLSRFSRMLRMVIDYSERNFISLEKEIEFLNLYLGLESLRFGQSFKYTIEVDQELDEEESKIPSLLIQPFAENAIWHGLLHKDGNRELMIRFQIRNEDQLLCIIEDNGIGRKRAAEINAGKFDAQKHESKGMKISQERIDLVRLQTDQSTDIRIEDLYDDSGNASGTRVTVTLPLELV